MKGFFVFVLLLASTACGTEFENDHEASRLLLEGMARSGISTRIMEAEITKKIEEVLMSIPTFTEYSNLTLNILNETIVMNGNLENTTILGLENHVIDRVKLNIIPISFAAHIGLPGLSTNGLYDAEGLFAKIVPIYGKGKQAINITDFSFFIKVDITSFAGQLIIKNVDLELSLGGLSFKLSNFMSGALGDVVCQIIEENISDYLARVLYWYGPEIETTISDIGNKFLEGKTINDILDWLQGKTTTTIPPTSPIPIF